METRGIGWAIKQMRNGQQVLRRLWLGHEMYLKLVPGYRGTGKCDPGGLREHLPYIGVKIPGNKFAPWIPSQAELLAEDWETL